MMSRYITAQRDLPRVLERLSHGHSRMNVSLRMQKQNAVTEYEATATCVSLYVFPGTMGAAVRSVCARG